MDFKLSFRNNFWSQSYSRWLTQPIKTNSVCSTDFKLKFDLVVADSHPQSTLSGHLKLSHKIAHQVFFSQV